MSGKSGIVNAPTGSGKTYALFIPIALQYFQELSREGPVIEGPLETNSQPVAGIRAIWIAPIRALTREILIASQRVVSEMKLDWRVEIRSGDTSAADRKRQLQNPPEILITTPESLHVIMTTKGYAKLFGSLKAVVVDEWHELLGSKRGVLVQLALSRLKAISTTMVTWGVSATILNLNEAVEVLLGPNYQNTPWKLVIAKQKKRIAVESIIPEEIEKYPWSGHLGIKLLSQIIPLIKKSRSTLIFTNTRSQCEIWYQKLLDRSPDLAGAIAMHHGSISRDLRKWVEEAIHEERLKAVVCTSSLDLGS